VEQQITIKPTPKNKPGHLLRIKKRMEITRRLNNNDPTAIDDMVQFVLDNAVVEAPGLTIEAIKEAIMEMSQEDYEKLFSADGVDPTSAA
jgi:hypothetical protein